MDVEIFISFIGASLLLIIMPGPDIIYVMTQSLSNGKKYGIATTLGLISGNIIHTTLVAFGVAALINNNENLYFFLKLCGAVYLFYLAFLSFREKNVVLDLDQRASKKGLLKLFRQGFIMNVLNPKVSIFFLAFLPGFLFSDELSVFNQIYILGFVFMALALAIFGLVAILSGSLRAYLKQHNSFQKSIKWFKITVFCGIGFFLLFS